jgi:uncharacterized protein YjiS (DUF1127 family)
MEFHKNPVRRPGLFSLRAVYRYFRQKSQNRQTVRQLRELSPEQLKDIGLSKHDLSYWE